MIIGIDCGYRTGGVAFLGDNWSDVEDLPVFTEGGVEVGVLMDLIQSVGPVKHIYIERQQAMPKQGVSSTFKLGYAFGQIVTTCNLSNFPHTIVAPSTWKKDLSLPKDKDAARRLAQQWYPHLQPKLKRKKDEHRAESILIAHYGRTRTWPK